MIFEELSCWKDPLETSQGCFGHDNDLWNVQGLSLTEGEEENEEIHLVFYKVILGLSFFGSNLNGLIIDAALKLLVDVHNIGLLLIAGLYFLGMRAEISQKNDCRK